MAGYVTNPGGHVSAQIGLLLLFMLTLFMVAHAVLGIARTAAVRLPLRTSEVGTVGLFAGDYSPKIGPFSNRGRKAFKIAVLMAALIGLVATWLWVVYVTYQASDPWFGWTLWGDTAGIAINAAVFVAACVVAVVEGVRGANKYSMRSLPHPFERLAPYLEDAIARGVNCELLDTGILRKDGLSLTSVKLPVRGSVIVFKKGRTPVSFLVEDTSHGIATVKPESQHDNIQLLRLDLLLRDNNL